MGATITHKDLLAAKCQLCGGDDPSCEDEGVVIASRCHPRTGIQVMFRRTDDVLRCTCAECGKFIVDIAFEVRSECTTCGMPLRAVKYDA